MRQLLEIFENIIDELKALQTKKQPWRNGNGEIEFPRLIAVGTNNTIQISEHVDKLISAVARQYRNDHTLISARSTSKEWTSTVRKTFGPALAQLDLDQDSPSLALALKNDIWNQTNKILKNVAQSRTYFFGVNLFTGETLSEFAIGPVKFEPKLVWLSKQFENGTISKITRRRIEKAWNGKHVKPRRPSFDSIFEKYILEATKKFEWVCSVFISQFDPDAGLDRVMRTIRLSLTTLALMWETPSRILEGFSFSWDPPLFNQVALSCDEGRQITAGIHRSKRAFGSFITSANWEEYTQRFADIFHISSEMNEFILSPHGLGKRDNILRCLSLAQTWFHEGCEESDTLLAVTKFASCLDTLSLGGKSKGILRVIEKSRGLKPNDIIHTDGFTVTQLVSKIYEKGRSQMLHGSIKKPFSDWADTRTVAESLAREALVGCMLMAGKDQTLIDPKSFQQFNQNPN